MKKTIKLFVVLFLVMLCCVNITVGAASVKIVKNEGGNEEGSNTLALFNDEFYIEVDEDTNIGYLIHKNRGNDIVIGTCKVELINSITSDNSIICYSNSMNNLGSLIIVFDNESGVVVEAVGDIENIFCVGTYVNVNLE